MRSSCESATNTTPSTPRQRQARDRSPGKSKDPAGGGQHGESLLGDCRRAFGLAEPWRLQSGNDGVGSVGVFARAATVPCVSRGGIVWRAWTHGEGRTPCTSQSRAALCAGAKEWQCSLVPEEQE